MPSIRKKMIAIAAIAAAALGGSALADAATSTSTTSTASSASATQSSPAPAPPARHDPSLGGHQANGQTEKLLTGETASKVEAAAKAKIPGATIERVENDVDTGSPYEAHMRKADGSEVIVYVDANFNVTGTGTMGPPR
jgi:maltose-binding protein MalE